MAKITFEIGDIIVLDEFSFGLVLKDGSFLMICSNADILQDMVFITTVPNVDKLPIDQKDAQNLFNCLGIEGTILIYAILLTNGMNIPFLKPG